MSDIIRIRRGLDINLAGKAAKKFQSVESSKQYAVKPTDFPGIFPKLMVKPGDAVKAGSPLFYDKKRPEVKFSSPVSGIVSEISRGERRSLLAVIIEHDGKDESVTFSQDSGSREKIVETLLSSGMWPVIRQRPYSIIANPLSIPKSIFISAFDTAPLAPDYDFIMSDNIAGFQKGIDILKNLTSGKIHLGVKESSGQALYSNIRGVEINRFEGPHPAGNIGVHIHRIDPLNKGEVVWFINPFDVARIGHLFTTGKPDNTKVIAVTGSELTSPSYSRVIAGTCITPVLKKNTKPGDLRFISGNVLSGTRLDKNGFLGFYDYQLTVIPEGRYSEFLGWALPGLNKFSVSRSFFSWLNPRKEYRVDTNIKGGIRAYVLTGVYEKVFPMDIYPIQLIKACLAEDIDKMERLGIYEVAEEDFALCEFMDPSKTNMQAIIRRGLDLIRKEME